MTQMRYTSTTRFLHWLVAILILATIPVANIMQSEDIARETQDRLFIFHKNAGVIILLLVAARLIWRAFNPAPPLPDSLPWAQRMAAFATHWLLYGAVIFMAVTGYLRVAAGGFPIELLDWLGVPYLVSESEPLEEWAQRAHSFGRFVLVPLLLLHIAAAIYHAVLRDGVFARIWPPLGR